MINKRFVIISLLVGISILSVISCGSDDEETDMSIVKPAVTKISNDFLLGTWVIVSINDSPPEEFFKSPSPLQEEVEEPTINTFAFIFTEHSAWTLNLDLDMAFNFRDNLPDQGVMFPSGKIQAIGVWSGIFSVEDPTLFLTTDESDVSLTPEPQDFIEKVFGMTEAQAHQDFIDVFKTDFLDFFEESTATLEGGTLTLITTPAKTLVLEKQ